MYFTSIRLNKGDGIYGSALINYFVTGAPVSEWTIAVPEGAGQCDGRWTGCSDLAQGRRHADCIAPSASDGALHVVGDF